MADLFYLPQQLIVYVQLLLDRHFLNGHSRSLKHVSVSSGNVLIYT